MKRTLSILVAAFVAFAALHTQAADEPKTLTIGDAAPPLDIETWIQDNDGQLMPVQNFEQDKVYIIEFWATWCGPCISSMPHLAETQTKYGYDTVRLISVSDEDVATIEKFLEREVQGEDDKTYDDLTSVYSLTTDPDRSVSKDYMRAAGQNGIPTAFIVGKTGLVEWIGHPMRMDEPLEQIVEDRWDREAFAEGFKKKQAAALLAMKLRTLMRSDDKSDWEQAYEMVASQLAEMEDAPSSDKQQMETMQVSLLVKLERADEAAALIRDRLNSVPNELYAVMNAAQRILALPADVPGLDKKPLVALAIEKIDGVSDAPQLKDNTMLQVQVKMAVAQLYTSSRQMDEAIQTLEEAREAAGDEARLTTFLDRMLKQVKDQAEALAEQDADESTEQ
ncbi:TlpA family protein disulfide reductase [Roseimaritima ulvae]|uniref:Thiol-disulfide oxidoreductase ResA n=1 Tax=Roseimaritima ulvae TaxID=980254 RepID=A0A5B9R0G5_9BACT|nr:TlpA disulfide reductase family protein [Roseimaritima ulvae]QEG43710.1 Thiol-disulfide oxidoreductase ResA [Roseimaritima ulvae]